MSTPPAALAPDTFAARLYAALGPVAQQDAQVAWSLLILCNAAGVMFQEVEDLVRDTPDGPGWSLLVDLDRCPPGALPWLGQMVGVRLAPGTTEAEQRVAIKDTSGFRRGRVDALVAAIKATLTGPATVILNERSGDPVAEPIAYAYRLKVRTYTDQTPDPGATLAAALTQKPGALALDYATTTGQTWAQVKAGYASWAAVKAHYAAWYGVKTDEP